jgi:hypothetical protein
VTLTKSTLCVRSTEFSWRRHTERGHQLGSRSWTDPEAIPELEQQPVKLDV